MRNLLLITTILLLSACGNQTIRQDKPHYSGLIQAQHYFNDKQFNKAARAFEHLYMNYKEDRFALKAAESWIQIKQFQNAQNLMALIPESNSPLYLLVKTDLYLNGNQLLLALETLRKIPASITGEMTNHYLMTKANVCHQNELFLEAAMALITLSELEKSQIYNDDIVNNLLQVSEDELTQALFNNQLNELEQGWIEAAYITYSQDKESIKQWKSRWANHPANAFFIHVSDYNNIAVLLPLSGKYQSISSSIQNGMMAALYRSGATDQTINFFDTGSNSEFFSYAWYGAIESGAEFIIGPLLKSSVQKLTQLNSSTVPVMLLNQLEEGVENSQGFYQFALSQEDEIRNVANRLMIENKKRIMILAPESQTGRKLARELEADILYNDGQVVSYEFYSESINDYSREIKQALGLNDSLIRKRQLQSIISHPLKSTAQIRPDIDAIVILARPKHARLIKPQLKFFQAENVPVYSTSQLLSNEIDATKDRDLNGIKFCQSSFVIDPNSMQSVLEFDVNKINSDRKFFAFGYDAIALTPRLDWLQTMQNQKIESLSGMLSVGLDGKINRDLAWGQFKNGVPILLPPIEIIDTAEEFQ